MVDASCKKLNYKYTCCTSYNGYLIKNALSHNKCLCYVFLALLQHLYYFFLIVFAHLWLSNMCFTPNSIEINCERLSCVIT